MTLDITKQGLDLLYGIKGPTSRQIEFRDNPNKYKLYGGAVGGGKSVCLCSEAIRLSLAFPGNRGFMCRHEATAFKMTTLQTLLSKIQEIEDITKTKLMHRHHKTEKTIWFTNKSRLEYGALGDIQDFERIKSLEIGHFEIDEASETPYANFQMLKSRLRWKLPDGTYPPFFGLLASNPEPGWVKDLFVTAQVLGELPPNHAFIPALPIDNPYLPPTYVEDLRTSNPGSWVDRYIEGSWTAMEGQIYNEFDPDTHIIDPIEIPENVTKFIAIDHGQNHPTCCLWFWVDSDKNIFIYDEYYSPGIVSAHCREIKRISGPDMSRYNYRILPPECWGKTKEKYEQLWSIYDDYLEAGISCTKANNEVLGGINRVGEYLHIQKDRIHPITGNVGSPMLFIYKKCKNLIREMYDYTWKKQKEKQEQVDKPVKSGDDAVDALRYGIMTRPAPALFKPVENSNSFDSWKKRLKNINNIYGGIGRDIYG